MSRKKMTKTQLKKRKLDQKKRRLHASVLTQLDNMIYTFLYELESPEFEVSRVAEKYLDEYLFNTEFISKVEKEIKGKKDKNDLIEGARKLAREIIEKKEKSDEKRRRIEIKDVEDAIHQLQKEKIWPYILQVFEAKK